MDREIAQQEILVVRPAAGGVDGRVRALVEPFADQPLQLLELLVMQHARRVLFADAGIQPSPALLDVENGVAAESRGLAPAGLTRVWPSSLATSGPRNRSDSIEISIVAPGRS